MNMSISKKSSIISIVMTIVTLIIGYFVLNYYKGNLIDGVYSNIKKELLSVTNDRVKAKFDVGISNAVSISNDYLIKQALEENSRDLAIEALAGLSASMKKNTPFKNIKVHVHTKDNKSFLRIWKKDKFGDDLSSFRRSVVKVNSTKEVVNTFEIGKAGLGIRSVVPVFSEENKHLGSLEFMQGINSVAKTFSKNNDGFLLLMDASLAVAEVDKSKKLKNYIISQKFVDKNFLADAKTINFDELLKTGLFHTPNYTYTFEYVKDFENKKLGIILVGKPHEVVNQAIDEASKLIFIALFILIVALLATLLLSLVNMRTNIILPIKNLKAAIDNIKDNSSESTHIEVLNKDEIGDVVTSFNEYLDSIREGIAQDRRVIDEANSIIEKVNSGLFNETIKQEANSKEVSSLITQINKMIITTQKNLTTLSKILVELSHAKYDVDIKPIEGATGLIASLISGVKVTQSTMSDVMALIDSSNERLENSSNELTVASENLSKSSNIQAAGLEETAAAVEEIASTIATSSENAEKMAIYAKNVTQSSKTGKELAYKTVESMEQLNNEVSSINEAITIIDQIAFQTNILSLNAAVEAATAGEAGKGFAVVAQEVRNLASRSAEAAKEIKDLVESATNKALQSKNITDEMLTGFNELDENIDVAISLIDEVANATKEQGSAISQINDTVNSLDKATQENASLATDISSMARNTQGLVEQLKNAVSNTSFSEESKKGICDTNMIFTINKLKADHIQFKDTNLNQCKSQNFFTVKNHTECHLGKWLMENSDKPFAKTAKWQELLVAHEKVHTLVQNTVDSYAKKDSNENILITTDGIEDNINKVFELLEDVKAENCKNI